MDIANNALRSKVRFLIVAFPITYLILDTIDKHQLPLSSVNESRLPSNVHDGGWDSSSTVSRALFWDPSSNSGSYSSSPSSGTYSVTKSNYAGSFGQPDAALREFYRRYILYGSGANTADDPDMYWAEQPAEEAHVQSLRVRKKQESKNKETDGRTKKSNVSSDKTSRKGRT